eukprot:264308_1
MNKGKWYDGSTLQHIHETETIKIAIFGPINNKKALCNVLDTKSYTLPRKSTTAYKNTYTLQQSINDYERKHSRANKLLQYWNTSMPNGKVFLKIINPYLTDKAYCDPSIQYSHITKTDNIVEIEGKYDSDVKDTLQTRHIKNAHGFIIAYDVRFMDGFKSIKNHLDIIYKIKGYDKLLSKLKIDQMCFFPVILLGINGDLTDNASQLIKSKGISRSQTSQLALQYCTDFLRMEIFKGEDWLNALWVKDNALSTVDMYLQYYHYMTMSNEQIDAFRHKKSTCRIL